jgi:hypothetical protein
MHLRLGFTIKENDPRKREKKAEESRARGLNNGTTLIDLHRLFHIAYPWIDRSFQKISAVKSC